MKAFWQKLLGRKLLNSASKELTDESSQKKQEVLKGPDPVDALLPSDAGRWVIVANITRKPRRGPIPGETYYGTKAFSPGTKVYIVSVYWGSIYTIKVVGRARKSKRLVCCDIRINILENLRTKLLYSPAVTRKLVLERPIELKSVLLKTEAEAQSAMKSIKALISD